MTTYTCHFFHESTRRSITTLQGMEVFTSGFWLDIDGNLASDSLGVVHTWIPPHKIDYITRSISQ